MQEVEILTRRLFWVRDSWKVGKKKRMGATNVGVRRAHSYSWSLSSPQQPLETEDSPTVSLAPQYTSQRVCRASSPSETVITAGKLRLSYEKTARADKKNLLGV